MKKYKVFKRYKCNIFILKNLSTSHLFELLFDFGTLTLFDGSSQELFQKLQINLVQREKKDHRKGIGILKFSIMFFK